jgi:hypothetical protein
MAAILNPLRDVAVHVVKPHAFGLNDPRMPFVEEPAAATTSKLGRHGPPAPTSGITPAPTRLPDWPG